MFRSEPEKIDFWIDLFVALRCGVIEGEISYTEALVFELYRVHGHDQDEIAEHLGKTTTYVSRALTQVENYLQHELVAYSPNR